MNFENRLKGKITETIVKEILVDEGYRVIDSGIEHILREVACLTQSEYSNLSLSLNLRKLPDLIVMNKSQSKSYLIEIKYRQFWDGSLIYDLKQQVEFFNKIVLVCVNGTPQTESPDVSGGTHLRAIHLRFNNDSYEAQVKKTDEDGLMWITISENTTIDWWQLIPMQFIFDEMTSLTRPSDDPNHGNNINTLLACRAIGSLMDKSIWEIS